MTCHTLRLERPWSRPGARDVMKREPDASCELLSIASRFSLLPQSLSLPLSLCSLSFHLLRRRGAWLASLRRSCSAFPRDRTRKAQVEASSKLMWQRNSTISTRRSRPVKPRNSAKGLVALKISRLLAAPEQRNNSWTFEAQEKLRSIFPVLESAAGAPPGDCADRLRPRHAARRQRQRRQ